MANNSILHELARAKAAFQLRAIEAVICAPAHGSKHDQNMQETAMTAEHITQKYLRRYPDSKRARSWVGRKVHIRTENGIWRPEGRGYTSDLDAAGVWSFEDAQRQVAHCGPEKRASFIAAKGRPDDRT